jgi:hypothetical protein
MGLSENSFYCENAASHLEECCPSFSATSDICRPDISCGGETPLWFTTEESECILDRSCEDIVAAKICERAEAIVVLAQAGEDPDAGADTGTGGGAARGLVCP